MGQSMNRFARIVFFIAGAWGVVVLLPLYFLHDITGRAYAPPVSYPHFFYGFLAVAMAWQCAFFVIASSPARYRLMMIPAVLEKLGYIVGTVMLYRLGRIGSDELSTAFPDLVLCILFVIAFVRTTSADARVDRLR
jgi:hypothetical protein